MYACITPIVAALLMTVSVTGAPRQNPPATPAAANPKVEQYKKDVALEVDGMREDWRA